jgi:hypothetical protein
LGVEKGGAFAKSAEISKNSYFGVRGPRGRFLMILTPPWQIKF